MKYMNKTPDEIIDHLCDELKSGMRKVRDKSYEDGYDDAIKRAYSPEVKDEELDVKSIRDFAAWCYVNGVDFSTMKSSKEFIDEQISGYLSNRKLS